MIRRKAIIGECRLILGDSVKLAGSSRVPGYSAVLTDLFARGAA